MLVSAWKMQIDEVPWLAAVVHLTEVGIDTLMVLTGFLATLSLIPALQQVNPCELDSHLPATNRLSNDQIMSGMHVREETHDAIIWNGLPEFHIHVY